MWVALSHRMQRASAFAPIKLRTTLQRNERHLAAVPKRTPRIVAMGGGTGLPSVLEGLCELSDEDGATGPDHISAIVTVTDEGGSSGRLRRDFGVLPPGDIRNCLAAVAPPDSPFKRLLQHRFVDGEGLAGHAVGNLMLTALSQITGDFASAVEQLEKMMGLRGRVLPTTGRTSGFAPKWIPARSSTAKPASSGPARESAAYRSIPVRNRCRKCFAPSSTLTALSSDQEASIRASCRTSSSRGCRDDVRRGRCAHLRRELDDGTGRDGRLHPRRSPARHPSARRLRPLRLHRRSQEAIWRAPPRAATRCRVHGPLRSMCR